MNFVRCEYHQNIFSFGLRIKSKMSARMLRVPRLPSSMATTRICCTAAGRNQPRATRETDTARAMPAAAQSIGRAAPPFARSFNCKTRYPEKARYALTTETRARKSTGRKRAMGKAVHDTTPMDQRYTIPQRLCCLPPFAVARATGASTNDTIPAVTWTVRNTFIQIGSVCIAGLLVSPER